MSILPILAQTDSLGEVVGACVAAGVAVALAVATGVFRRKSVVGPPRVADREELIPFWMILLFGLLIWVFIPSTYGAMTSLKQQETATTAPTTRISLSPYETVILGIVSAAGVVAALLVANAVVRPGGLAKLGLSRKTLVRAVVPGMVCILIVLPLMYVAGVLTQGFWQLIGLDHPTEHPLLRIFADEGESRLRIMIVVSAVFFAPVYEELLFRGHLQTLLVYSMARLLKPLQVAIEEPGPEARWAAIFITSIFFTMVHQELWMMPPIFLLSICLGYVYERTGNLWVPMLLHAAFNAANVMMFLSRSQH